jgi:DNA-binding response OmpR family regulator
MILLIDDEPAMATLVSMALQDTGTEVIQVLTLEEAKAQVRSRAPDLILLDLSLGSEDGMQLLERGFRDVVGRIPIVVFSIHDSRRNEAIRLGARSFLTKPFRRAELQAAVEPYLTKDPQ